MRNNCFCPASCPPSHQFLLVAIFRMKLYLITHAHTQIERDANATKWRLSTTGAAEAEALTHERFWDEVEGVVLSSEPKTHRTVAPVLAQRSLPIRIDARFDELRRGSGWIDDYAARVEQVLAVPEQPIGGWESAASALARFLDGVAALTEQTERALALVSHGLVLSLYRAHLLGFNRVRFADWRALSFGAVAQADPVERLLLCDFRPVIAGSAGRGSPDMPSA